MADGRVDDATLVEACRAAARTMHAFDMAAIAEAMGSVISAVLFGALAGAGVLPFPRQAFEGAIRRGGVGIKASLAAFTAGFEAVTNVPEAPAPSAKTMPPPTLDGQDADVVQSRPRHFQCPRERSSVPASNGLRTTRAPATRSFISIVSRPLRKRIATAG
jgi:hypothetical protein